VTKAPERGQLVREMLEFNPAQCGIVPVMQAETVSIQKGFNAKAQLQ
jgi:hypothetical protein